jgi:hypothetical protein
MFRNQNWFSLRPVEFTIAAIAQAIPISATAPTQVPDRIAANEATAIEALRSIATAQARFKAAVDIDTNCDGVGEYGYLAELTGTLPMRVSVGDPCVPAAGFPPNDVLLRGLLRSSFGLVTHSCASYHGYLFMIWLPTATAVGHVGAYAEDMTGGKMAAPFPSPANGAHLWCCYAWPVRYAESGKRAFFINQRGDVLEYSNRSTSPFSGLAFSNNHTPSFDEAYSVVGDMGSPPRIGVPNANGSIWWPVP